MELYLQLKEVLKDRGITQKELAKMTGLKESIISDLVNNRRTAINRGYVGAIVQALKLDDIRELLVVK